MKKETKIGWAILASLTVLFAILKITMFLDIAWLWVFAPLWLPYAAAIGTALLVMIIAIIKTAWETVTNGKL